MNFSAAHPHIKGGCSIPLPIYAPHIITVHLLSSQWFLVCHGKFELTPNLLDLFLAAAGGGVGNRPSSLFLDIEFGMGEQVHLGTSGRHLQSPGEEQVRSFAPVDRELGSLRYSWLFSSVVSENEIVGRHVINLH